MSTEKEIRAELNHYKELCMKLEDKNTILKSEIREMLNIFLSISRKTDANARKKLFKLEDYQVLEHISKINDDVREFSKIYNRKDF